MRDDPMHNNMKVLYPAIVQRGTHLIIFVIFFGILISNSFYCYSIKNCCIDNYILYLRTLKYLIQITTD